MTQQIDLWKGPFGDQYQDRNSLTDEEVNKRGPLMEYIIKTIYMNAGGVIPESVLEVGAGQGPNLAAWEKISLKIQRPIKLYATEINNKARENLKDNVKSIELLDEIPTIPVADLVYTYGVLIHTHPAHLRGLQEKIYGASKRFIACCEYFAPETRPIKYRGENDALWLDDYGTKWIDNFSLRLLGYGFMWKKVTGLDNVTFWVFEKTEKMI